MADNNSLNINAVTPLVSLKGGTGVSNSFNLTVSATSSINQNVTTTGSPVFTASTSGNLNLTGNTISSTNSNGNVSLIPNGSGLVLINSAVPSGLSFGSISQSIAKNSSAGFAGVTYDATTPADGTQFIIARSRSSTVGSFVALSANDTLGNLSFYGDDGTSFVQSSAVQGFADSTISTGIIPGLLMFYTANNSGVLTSAMSLNKSQVATFTNPIVTSGVNDSNGNRIFLCVATPASVNFLTFNNSITSNAPTVQSQGSDTNVNLALTTQGTGNLVVNSLSSTPVIIFSGTTYQHISIFQFSNTAQTRTITFPDASGTVQFQGKSLGSTVITEPAASQTSSLTIGTAYQNTFGYDIVLTVYVSVASAVTASILSGVGPTNTPTQQTIVSGLTVSAVSVITVPVYIPSGYYALISTSGTISATISGQQALPV